MVNLTMNKIYQIMVGVKGANILPLITNGKIDVSFKYNCMKYKK